MLFLKRIYSALSNINTAVLFLLSYRLQRPFVAVFLKAEHENREVQFFYAWSLGDAFFIQ